MREDRKQEHQAMVKNLSRRNSIDDDTQSLILAKFERVEIKKSDYLLKGDSVCKRIYYVFSGALKSYVSGRIVSLNHHLIEGGTILQLEKLPKGLYFVKVFQSDTVSIHSFIKQ